MYNAQQSSCTNFTSYAYQSVSSIPNPNAAPKSHSFPSVLSGIHHHPDGIIDPYANPASYSSVVDNPVAQTPFYQDPYHDPNQGSQNWIVGQPLVQYSTFFGFQALKPCGSVIASSSNPVDKRGGINQAFRSVGGSKVATVSNAVRCELCETDCNSIDVYEKHLSGKKHKRKLEAIYAPCVTLSKQTDKQVSNSSKTGHISATSSEGGTALKPVPAGEKLDQKAHALVEGGSSVDSLKICTICNVICNSEIVYADHLAGKKHTAQVSASTSDPLVKDDDKKGPQEMKNSHPVQCEICDISCNNAEVLNTHLMGKKHRKNLEKHKKLWCNIAAPNRMQLLNGGKKKTTDEGLEAKKRKIMEGGVQAFAVRTCYVCNVVCNSETVFNSHVAGKKHKEMVLSKQGVA